MREIHLAGAYGVREIIEYNQTRNVKRWSFPEFFQFWKICPSFTVRNVADTPAHDHATLMVINLDLNTWQQIQDILPKYRKTVLVQIEGYNGWEEAYKNCQAFDYFVNFDKTYAWHPGFRHVLIPYEPNLASSHLTQRGWRAMRQEWRASRKRCLSLYVGSILRRKNKAVLIGTLHTKSHYHIRHDLACKWSEHVEVYGSGWPPNMANYRGSVANKLVALNNYRYALVMENQRQPGYITEKLLDCFVSGTLPLYWGAPDIFTYIPEQATIVLDETAERLDQLFCSDDEYHYRRSVLRECAPDIFEMHSRNRFYKTLAEVLAD